MRVSLCRMSELCRRPDRTDRMEDGRWSWTTVAHPVHKVQNGGSVTFLCPTSRLTLSLPDGQKPSSFSSQQSCQSVYLHDGIAGGVLCFITFELVIVFVWRGIATPIHFLCQTTEGFWDQEENDLFSIVLPFYLFQTEPQMLAGGYRMCMCAIQQLAMCSKI